MQKAAAYIEASDIFATIMQPNSQFMDNRARIYLDHAATTPMVPAARAALFEAAERWANPSSPHSEGRAARAALEDARRRIAAALEWDGEVIFTSGASEAISIALARHTDRRIAASTVEHDAVLRLLPGTIRLPVDGNGGIDLEVIQDFAAENSGGMICVQSVNNETGVLQPLAEVAKIARRAGCVLFSDCSQSAGKLPLPGADLIAVSAHKLGGPPGIGALLVRDLGLLRPTGGQEQGYRAGTENLPAIAAFAAALDEYAMETRLASLQIMQMNRASLDAYIRSKGGEIAADEGLRMPHIATYRIRGLSSQAQLIQFDHAGISVSAGSACSSGTLRASHVLTAMGWDTQAASEVVRVSFSYNTTRQEIDAFTAKWTQLAQAASAA